MNSGKAASTALAAERTHLVPKTLLVLALCLGVPAAGQTASPERRHMKAIAPEEKFTVCLAEYPDARSPNPKGWYHSVAGVVSTPEGLVAVYRRSDSHTCFVSDIMVAHSKDGGRTWTGHRSISHRNVFQQHAVWVAPQISRLKDGRLVIISDLGSRTPSQDWPMLTHWQKPGRGMSNHIFWSRDNGRTWDGPHKVDDIGGEPGYIVELSDGTLVYTRTESNQTSLLWNPPLPWGNTYYYNVAVFSGDGGKTWSRTSVLSDDPHQGDCEVGIVELSPGRLVAATRIGLGGGAFGQPSRLIHSYDNGRTWKDARLASFYGQRTIIGKLASGKLLVTYRNRWGTPASYAFLFDPREEFTFQPSSFIWDESLCTLEDGAMVIRSGEGGERAVDFSLYPAQAPGSRVEIEAELQVLEAAPNGCHIGAGVWVRFEPSRVSLADRPEDGFDIDARQWHTYRILRENGEVSIFVGGALKLRKPAADILTRHVHFGNRTGRYTQNASHTRWRSLSARVQNQRDHSIDWKWNARQGFPDQFRRDRMVLLDASSDSGYSGWTQMPDGRIVILDYTNEQFRNASWEHGRQPFVRAYVTTEAKLAGR